MRKLKIAQIAPIWYPIPPKKYGGIEKIVHYLAEGLKERGHNVYLFASGDSKTKAKLFSDRKKGLAEDKIPWSESFWPTEHLSFSYRNINKIGNFDIIHSHTGIRTFFFQGFTKAPTLHTFHNPLGGNPKKLSSALKIMGLYKNSYVNFISKSHKTLCPVKLKNSYVVYNGIDEKLFAFNQKPKNYFLWVGRVEKAKGIENALKAAKQANIKLKLVGKIDTEKQPYFNRKVKPYLNEKIQFLGEKPQSELVKLYQNAKALLYPIEWNEPFGLVMAEAMACGAPVIVFNMGSAKEVVKDKKTGFVVPFKKKGKVNIEGLTEAIKNIDDIKRTDCRKWVENNFTLKNMLDNYEELYKKICD